jgi:UDP-N-acetylglucosamine transferase subunit ALG13
LPLLAGRLGENVESRLAPPLYRNVPICTPSQSSADDIARRLRIPPAHISVTPPGVDAHFFSDGPRSPNPLVVAVGRMVPSKRFDMLVDILVEVRDRHPGLEAVIVGDGKERAGLQAHIQARHAAGWCRVVGRISEADLVVAHAGVGSALEALSAGRCPVLVPRRKAFGEHVDDHQSDIAAELAGRGLCIAREADELSEADLLDAAARTVRPPAEARPFRLRGARDSA